MARGKLEGRDKRKARIRKKLSGSAERPRLTVFRSNKQIYAQVVDDRSGRTLACASSVGLDPQSADEKPNKTAIAAQVGEVVAGVCIAKGIDQVVFDRSGYIYHGRVKALADGARKGGLNF